ncbi:MAG: sigma-70 family RNA polymerase sigma factor, partial [Pirellulaceae bacterium]|nr:sigma-70 family RNA polymerase sigma factor [Pirellulaceae bacterium]
VLRSCFLKSRRKQQPTTAGALELDVDEIPAAQQSDEIDGQRIQMAVAELPDEFRVVLVMFYFEELSYKEIAEQLDLKIGTVMSRLSRAKGRLRHKLLATQNFDRSSSTASSLVPPTNR